MPAAITAAHLYRAARTINLEGLHRGPHFAHHNGAMDPSAAIYFGVTGTIPNAFYGPDADADQRAADLIRSNPQAMAAIRALSASLDTEPPLTDGQPDPIEHIAQWVSPDHGTDTPTVAAVLGRMLRAIAATTQLPDAA